MAIIEDGELVALRQQAGQAQQLQHYKQLIDKMGGNPKTRQQLLGLMKQVNPDLAIPEIDAKNEVLEAVNTLSKRIDDKEKAEEEARAEERKQQAVKSVEQKMTEGRAFLSKQGYTADGIEKVEKIMQTRGLADYEAATALFEKENPPQEESVIPNNYAKNWDMFEAAKDDNETLKAAVSLPKGPGQERALNRWTQGEVQNAMKDLGIGRQARR